MHILKILTPKRRLGNFGEDAACKYLKKHGYKILERNYVAFNNEIDIIAKCGDATVFVEVKTRTAGILNPNEPRPACAVTPEKQRDIIKTAKCYIAHKRAAGRVRFDVIEVLAQGVGRKQKAKEINHLKNTFNYDTANHRR